MHPFEIATRKALRFPTCKGSITVEDLWQAPLRSKDQFNLDVIGKGIRSSLDASAEVSLVDAKPKDGNAELGLMFDIVKRVIEVKVGEENAAKTRAENKAKREKLMGLLQKKQDAAAESMSEKEILKQLAALDDA